MVNKTIAAILGIAVAGIAGYELYKAYAKQQQQTGGGGGAGGGGTGGGAGGGAGGTPPPSGFQEVLQTNSSYYRVGDTIYWTASNLIVGQQYTVGFLLANQLIDWQTFTANSSTHYGQTKVTSQITPGSWMFLLVRVQNPSDPLHGIIVSHVTLIILFAGGGGPKPFSSGPGLSYSVISQGMQYTIVP
jgi:hypothetical protein